jgi:hypothetical protein
MLGQMERLEIDGYFSKGPKTVQDNFDLHHSIFPTNITLSAECLTAMGLLRRTSISQYHFSVFTYKKVFCFEAVSQIFRKKM